MLNRSQTRKTMSISGAKLAVFVACVLGASGSHAAPNQIALRGPLIASATPAPEMNGPLTFQAWKSLRVDEARLVLERLSYENQLEKMPVIDRSPGIRTADTGARVAVANRNSKSGRADSRAEQARMNLEIAQDLTVNDYLVIYLSQFKSREAILDVARRLAPEDIADLLMSYQKLSMGGQIAEHTITPSLRTPPRPL
ncbi:hypothetical protein BH10BDE1_BH10BDE1_21520 [soil metagenome]